MKNNIGYYVTAAAFIFLVCPLVFAIGSNAGFDRGRDTTAKFFNEKEPILNLQVLAYEAKYRWCKKDKISVDMCDRMLLHNLSTYPNPDGVLNDRNAFVFSNTFRSSKDTIVYEVVLSNDGKVLEESRPVPTEALDDYPVER